MIIFLKICLIFLFSSICFCQRHQRRGEDDGPLDGYPYFQGHDSPNEPNYGPVMISNLPVLRKSASDYGYGNSIDEYMANVDRELAARRSERDRRPRMRSMLRQDGWVETKPGEAIDVPLQTASPNIPPDVIEYFEKSRKNDLALAATIEQKENDKISKDLYFKRNEDNLRNVQLGEQGANRARSRSMKKSSADDSDDVEGMGQHSGRSGRSGKSRAIKKFSADDSGDAEGMGEHSSRSGKSRSIKKSHADDSEDHEGTGEHSGRSPKSRSMKKSPKNHKKVMKRSKKMDPKKSMDENQKKGPKTPPKNDQEQQQEKLVDEGEGVGDEEEKKPVKARKGKKKPKGK